MGESLISDSRLLRPLVPRFTDHPHRLRTTHYGQLTSFQFRVSDFEFPVSIFEFPVSSGPEGKAKLPGDPLNIASSLLVLLGGFQVFEHQGSVNRKP